MTPIGINKIYNVRTQFLLSIQFGTDIKKTKKILARNQVKLREEKQTYMLFNNCMNSCIWHYGPPNNCLTT